MTETKLTEILNELLLLPHETEWVEFKEAKNNYDFNKLGKYFSALSNEANLNNKPEAWLIFGVASRKEIDNLLMDKLPDILDKKQKKNKIKNILYEMSAKDKIIFNDGTYNKPAWKLSSKK